MANNLLTPYSNTFMEEVKNAIREANAEALSSGQGLTRDILLKHALKIEARRKEKPEEKPEVWNSGDSEEARNHRLHRLCEIMRKRALEDLQEAISLGFNVNERFNTNTEAMKANRHSCFDVMRDDIMQPLHMAAAFSWTDGAVELLRGGADVNSFDYRAPRRRYFPDQSYTPLMHACCSSNALLVRTLLDAGADISSEDPEDGTNPIQLALGKFRFPIIELLLARGVCLSESNVLHILTFQQAVDLFTGPLLTVPHAYQLDVGQHTETAKVVALELMELHLKNGADPNMEREDQLASFYVCFQECGTDMRAVQLLLAYGAQVDRVGSALYFHEYSHMTPLLAASNANNNQAMITWLVKHGADVNWRFQHFGQTMSILTHVLEKGGLEENAWALLQAGSDVEQKDVDLIKDLALMTTTKVDLHFKYTGVHAPPLISAMETLRLMQEFVTQPRSLKWLVRAAIRSKLGVRQVKMVEKLPLPTLLRQYLRCSDL